MDTEIKQILDRFAQYLFECNYCDCDIFGEDEEGSAVDRFIKEYL
jgi:hypothetical protein